LKLVQKKLARRGEAIDEAIASGEFAMALLVACVHRENISMHAGGMLRF
jgi:hypothetical protein